jgi:heptaprenyl diphosphate synthase
VLGIPVGFCGYSVPPPLAHMAAQVWVAYVLFIPHQALLRLLPVLMTAAVIFGVLTGIIAASMLNPHGSRR